MNPTLPMPPSSSSRRSFFSRCLLALTGMPCLARPSARAEEFPDNTPPPRAGIINCQTGPWGRLSYYHFYLEAPAYVVSQFPLPSPMTKWVFQLEELGELPLRMRDAGLSSATIASLTDPRRVVRTEKQAHLFPRPVDLESMTPEVRAEVYKLLATNPANIFHHSPVFFLADSVDEWAKDSDMPEELISSIKALSYRSGDALVFSDVPLLLSTADSVEQAKFIMQKLTRVRTLMPRLELAEGDSVQEIVRYWTTGLGLRRMDIEPLLSAIVNTEGVSYLDLLHLLPPTARKLLFTYPDASLALEGRLPDCHWTSLNFFNYTPAPHLLDMRLATSTIKEEFEKVETPYAYGDVLLFISPEGGAVHSATYLADDILFSKNGSNMLAPWLLMRMNDLERLYGVTTNRTRIERFRHKKALGT